MIYSNVHCRLVALLDPGSTHSIIRCSFIDGVRIKKLQKMRVSYKVAGGNFYTNYKATLGISLPKFSQTNIVRHHFAINDSKDEGIGYDVIIGQDLCDVLGIDVQYSDCTIQMNGRSIAMKDSIFPVQQADISSREIK
jgi:hypothetical protein